MVLPILVFLFAAFLPPCRGGEGKPADARIDPGYEGKYPPETIQAFVKRLSAASPAAFEKACRHLGLACESAKKPLIRVRDAARFRPGRTAVPAARTFAEKDPEGFRLVILFHAESLMNGSGDPEKRLLHEMVHAAMRLALGDDRYGRLPVWLREGMALHIAGQGADRVRYEFSITLDAEALLDGLSGPHEPRDYGEDYLAVDFLARRGGRESLLRLTNLLLTGLAPLDAVHRVTGLEAGAFEAAFRASVLPALKESAAAELARFLPGYGKFQHGDYAASLEAFECMGPVPAGEGGLLAGSLTGKGAYYRAKCLFRLERMEDAASAFALVRTRHAKTCGLADDAAFFEAECLRRMGRLRGAREGFHRFVRDFPYSNFAAVGCHKLGLCAYLLGDFGFAREWCLGTWEAFPEESIAENALYDGANAARAMGRNEEAKRFFRRFLEAYPKSRFRALAEKRLAELEGEGGAKRQ
ncbi:MAG: tetratricopeptide repeat protein [Planctomycetota bacterium]|jgi:hypothetical protein